MGSEENKEGEEEEHRQKQEERTREREKRRKEEKQEKLVFWSFGSNCPIRRRRICRRKM